MAAGLGYKEFTTGDVLTAADANGYLASQVVMVFASAAARTSAITSPEEGMMSYLKDTNAVQYYSGSAWVAVGGGSTPVIKQFVSNNNTTSQTLSTTTYTDVTGASVTITPTSASSDVFISVTFPVEIQRQTNALLGYSVKLFRGATELDEWENIVMLSTGVNSTGFIQSTGMVAINYKDSPATTSATTYKIQAKLSTTANLGTSFSPGANGTRNISAMEF